MHPNIHVINQEMVSLPLLQAIKRFEAKFRRVLSFFVDKSKASGKRKSLRKLK